MSPKSLSRPSRPAARVRRSVSVDASLVSRLPVGTANQASPYVLDAQTLIDDLAATNCDALELAKLVSLASRIEPELLRAARLELLPSADASAEADLWLSPLMSSRSAMFAVMRPTVADVLREQLCSDQQHLNSAWRVLKRIHADVPAALRTEEEITWRVMANSEDPEVGRLFESVLLAMEGGRSGLAKWAARALPRMPSQARQSGGAWRVAQKASEVLGGEAILNAQLTSLPPVLAVTPGLPIEDLPKISVGLRLFDDALRISEPPEELSQKFEIPQTTPLLLEVKWQLNGKPERRTVTFGRGSTQVVRPIDSDTLQITTAAREVYTLRFLTDEWRQQQFTAIAVREGLAARIYRGDGAVMLAFDMQESRAKGVSGFSVKRRGPDGIETAIGNRDLSKLGPIGDLSENRPIQKFRWLDVLPDDVSGPYSYMVETLRLDTGTLRKSSSVQVGIGVTPQLGAIEVGFTRGTFGPGGSGPLKPGRQLFDFSTAPYSERYRLLGSSAYRMMSDFIAACVDDPRSTVDVFAFDFDHPDILKSFLTLGKRLRIVLDDSPAHRNRQYEIEARLKGAGCAVFRAHFGRMSHSKVIIRCINGEPAAVLTGSANFSVNSLFAQHNYVIVIRDKRTASVYEDSFNEAITKNTGAKHSWVSVVQAGLPRMRVLICPSGELLPTVQEAVRRAKRSILYSLGDAPGAKTPNIIEAEVGSSQQLLKGGVIHSSSGQRVLWGNTEQSVRPDRERRDLTGTTTGATSGNGKFIVIDFDQPDAVVFAGSATFSQVGATSNGDNVLEIHDPSIATLFAVEALRMIDFLRSRAIASIPVNQMSSDPTDNWWQPFYSPQDRRFLERNILANASWQQDAPSQSPPSIKPTAAASQTDRRPVSPPAEGRRSIKAAKKPKKVLRKK